MAKKINCTLERWGESGQIITLTLNRSKQNFCYKAFKRICPGLTRGIMQGGSRRVILTQLKNGIKLELEKKR